jgi:hypothetical protein
MWQFCWIELLSAVVLEVGPVHAILSKRSTLRLSLETCALHAYTRTPNNWGYRTECFQSEMFLFIYMCPLYCMTGALCYKPEGRGFESRWSGFFNWPNPSSRTLALGSTQPLPEMSTRKLPGGGGKGRPARKADNLTAIDCLEKMWKPRRLTILWAFTACYRDSFTFILYDVHKMTEWGALSVCLSVFPTTCGWKD